MDDPRDAEDAVRELDGKRICGRRVKVHDIAFWIITPELVESEKSSTKSFNRKILLSFNFLFFFGVV